jgi:hypothetical protein
VDKGSGIFIGFVAVFLAFRAAIETDVFIDESDSAPSQEAREKWGINATPLTRTLLCGMFLLFAAFCFWKAWHS